MELQRARRKPADSLTAYDLLLRGNDLMLRLNESDFNRARGLLQQAIAEVPGSLPAWAYAAYWHILRIGQGWCPIWVQTMPPRCAARRLRWSATRASRSRWRSAAT